MRTYIYVLARSVTAIAEYLDAGFLCAGIDERYGSIWMRRAE